MSFNLYTSNCLEVLADKLGEVVSRPLQSTMDDEIIVVQSLGMKQWISLELAKRFGVWTNCQYPFPNAYLSKIYELLIPDVPDLNSFEREVLTWRIMKLLPDCTSKPGFETLRDYLEDKKGFLRTWQLARQIANVFDQYCIFRPKMILRWEAGCGKGWQADLWRLLSSGEASAHRASLRETFFKALKNPLKERVNKLSRRISVFGISALPPYYMDVFAALSELCEVNLFLMNPSREYWAEIMSEYEIAKTLRKERNLKPTVDDLHLEKGNSLLASMGRLGRDFLGLAMDYSPVVYEYFKQFDGCSLLHEVQNDILSMIDRGAVQEDRAPQKQLAVEQIKADSSISINSCHGPMREVEVLHDFILDIINGHPDIKPRDFLVMTPDIELYAPFVRAVFDAPEDETLHIPYFIADQTVRQESILVKKLFSIFELNTCRFGAIRVLDILDCPAVQRRFNLLPADLDLIHQWVRETRICWGIDSKYRASLGLPEIKNNTWQAGIERLLLGYAMPGREERMFNNILPYDNIEGMNSSVLGSLVTFVNTLFSAVQSLEERFTLSQWKEKLQAILDALFLPDEEEDSDFTALRSAIGRLAVLEKQSGFSESVELAVVKSWLETALREQYSSTSFLTGRVTFCAMLPMRSIPFKVICLLGMNDAAFPRKTAANSFDLIQRHPRRGDRSQRSDDRYLFLESIISAREKLYISYAGQSIQDNSEIPPSVLVSELLDYIEQGYAVPDNHIRDFLVVKHRLQAFSPRYFEPGGRLYSYSRESCAASKALLEERRVPGLFIKEAFPLPEQEQRIIRLQDLMSFFDHPAKYLLNRTAGLYLNEGAASINEREPFVIAGLDKYHLEQRVCEQVISGRTETSLRDIFAAAGMLPHGSAGDAALQSLIPDLRTFSAKVKSYTQGQRSAPVEISCICNGYTITGIIKDIWPEYLLRYRCARLKARDRLRMWIQHVVLNAANHEAVPRKSILLSTDHTFEAEPLDDAVQQYLNSFITVFQLGESRLVHFFPESSLAYVESIRKGKTRQEALKAALHMWTGNNYTPGESHDSYSALCFKDLDPFDEEFEALSRELYEPLMKCQRQVK